MWYEKIIFDLSFEFSVALAKKPTSDPNSALAKLQKHKEKIKSLEAEGKTMFIAIGRVS